MARFVVCSRYCQEEDIAFAWNEIIGQTAEILGEKMHDELIDATVKTSDEISMRIETLNLETKVISQKIT